MSGDLKYPDGIAGKILFDPIKKGADKLYFNSRSYTEYGFMAA